MPKTAKSADWSNALVTRMGQYQSGDTSSHTFDVMATEAINTMAAARGAADYGHLPADLCKIGIFFIVNLDVAHLSLLFASGQSYNSGPGDFNNSQRS